MATDRPRIVCLVGSTRFFSAFQRAAYESELAGEITVGPAFTPDVGPEAHGGTVGITPSQKVAIDAAFRNKIALADEVRVMNVGGYVGESTRRDIATAVALGKPITWLEPAHAFYLPGMPKPATSEYPSTDETDRARMTIDDLQALARVGSNNGWLRWWAHWNHPQNPAQMAISIMDESGRTVDCRDLERRGFQKIRTSSGYIIYVCDRVDEAGRPYVSRL